MSNKTKVIFIVSLILIIDQVSKIIVKSNMFYGQSFHVFGNWFIIRFIENPGMAFGIDIPGKIGKPALTIFRIMASIAIIWYIKGQIRKEAPAGLIICLSLVLAGAVGNIIDSVFYGLMYNNGTYYNEQLKQWISYSGIATLDFSGYAGLFKGCVVDMLYFPVIDTRIPEWFPFMKGEQFLFFRPIFNVADSSISIGVVLILIFQKRYFKTEAIKENEIITEPPLEDGSHI